MSAQGRAVGIDFISVFGLPPAEFVALAAELGCQHITIALTPMPTNPHGYPPWSLRDDAALRRDLVAAQRDHGVRIALGEGFLIRPGVDIRAAAPDIDLMAELGASAVNILSLDPDGSRGVDQLAIFADLAAARGLQATVELMPGTPIGDLASAVAAIREAGRPNLRLLIDAMHVFRSGATAADIAGLDRAMIGYVQLCDAPVVSPHATYADEARHHRLPPGDGELPLAALAAALPRDVSVGLEIPMLARAQAGEGGYERLAGCVAAARAILARADEQPSPAAR